MAREYDAYEDGRKCFRAGWHVGMNPNEPGSFNAIAWENGWQDERRGV